MTVVTLVTVICIIDVHARAYGRLTGKAATIVTSVTDDLSASVRSRDGKHYFQREIRTAPIDMGDGRGRPVTQTRTGRMPATKEEDTWHMKS